MHNFIPKISVILLIFASSCAVPHVTVTVPDIRLYSVAGSLTNGAIWADTQDATTGAISAVELVQLLEASEGSDPSNPKHAAAIILSADDYTAFVDAAESLCLQLGKYCTKQAQALIKGHHTALAGIGANPGPLPTFEPSPEPSVSSIDENTEPGTSKDAENW